MVCQITREEYAIKSLTLSSSSEALMRGDGPVTVVRAHEDCQCGPISLGFRALLPSRVREYELEEAGPLTRFICRANEDNKNILDCTGVGLGSLSRDVRCRGLPTRV
jgi:hypothetical protein